MNHVAMYATPVIDSSEGGLPATNVAWIKADYGLTAKEFQIIQHLALGKSPQQIAEITSNSPHTIRTHINSIYKKTRVNHMVGLMALLLAGPKNYKSL